MKVICFLILWIGGAVLQTLYELKVEPVMGAYKEKAGRRKNSSSTVKGSR